MLRWEEFWLQEMFLSSCIFQSMILWLPAEASLVVLQRMADSRLHLIPEASDSGCAADGSFTQLSRWFPYKLKLQNYWQMESVSCLMIPGVILYLLTQKVLRSTYKKQNLEETIKLAFAVLLEVCGYSLLSMLKYNTVHYVLDISPGFAQKQLFHNIK